MMMLLVRIEEEWKYVLEDSGGRCVMTHGTILMLQSYANNLAMELLVSQAFVQV